MEHFIQLLIDAMIYEPDNDPIDYYTVKTQDKTVEKYSVSVHSEKGRKRNLNAYCEYWD